uniref:uncharacterized protein LOC122584869 n=1 Tax=Erigeron canadensis TaxID=72917 RepID=UPI001CB9B380|nr:uncharacterized protein LOC122584869 [Erigeron canadensis]
MELNKKYFAAVFILFIAFAVHPAISRSGRFQLKNEKLITSEEIYEIDYRGPETHSYRPPPNRTSRDNSNGGPLPKPKMHGSSKRLSLAKNVGKINVKKPTHK